MAFLVRIVANAAAIVVATLVVPGIRVDGLVTSLLAGLALGLINAVVKPVLTILTLPITLITLGLFLFVLNAACLALAARLVPGFSIDGFWPALVASLVVSLVSWLLMVIARPPARAR